MKKDILDRYDRDKNGDLIIKISAKRIEDLYNDFDKESSFLKKDLNEELVEYIIDSVKELSNENFVIEFYFKEDISDNDIARIKNSICKFFSYLSELEKKNMKEQIKNSLIFMAIGVFFTAMAIIFGEHNDNVVQEVVSEGLMVAGWVSLWEALATFLIKWLPYTKKLKLFNRIIQAGIKFS